MRRRALRLRAFDYSTGGAYFVTTCTYCRRLTPGIVDTESVILSDLDVIARDRLLAIAQHHPAACVDAYVVMPNHVHVLTGLGGSVELGVVIATYEAAVLRTSGIRPVWQRGYHDHVVRDEADLERVREYIASNRSRWALDPENPSRRVVGRDRSRPYGY